MGRVGRSAAIGRRARRPQTMMSGAGRRPPVTARDVGRLAMRVREAAGHQACERERRRVAARKGKRDENYG